MDGRIDLTVRTAAATAAGLALADASIVVLALPPILNEFDASVEAVAAVIGAYTLALAITAFALIRWSASRDARRLAWIGMLGFGAASAGAGLAPSMALLIVLRAVQGVAAAAVLVAAFDILIDDRHGRRGRSMWKAAAILGAAGGPALGGAITEFLDWRAIFLAQAPVLVAAAVVCRGAESSGTTRPHTTTRLPSLSVPTVCLGLLSAALTGVLFLVVLLLISGWALSPLEGAAVVSTLPLAAFVGTRLPGDPAGRATVGSTLVGTGVLSLAFLPTDAIAMVVVPQLVAGVGMGMALPALAGGLLPERSPAEAARLLSVRHFGITVALAILAPVAAGQLDKANDEVRERGAALILDADLPVAEKLGLVEVAAADLDAISPRAGITDSLRDARSGVAPENRGEYDTLRRRADETLVAAVNEAFAPAFLICGAMALLAAAGLLVFAQPRFAPWALAACGVAIALVPIQAAIDSETEPDPVVIADPCEVRPARDGDGIDGLLQGGALALLDEAACSLETSRERLVLDIIEGESPPLRDLLDAESPPLGRLLERLIAP